MILTTSIPRLSRIQRYLWTLTAILPLSICAGGIALMTRTVAAQTASPSSQAPRPGAKNQKAAPDLACTYYDEKTVPHEGTCGYDKKDKQKYLCYLNSDPKQSQNQTGCESKLRRAEESKKQLLSQRAEPVYFSDAAAQNGKGILALGDGNEVDLIPHQAVGENAHLRSGEILANELKVKLTIGDRKKDRLTIRTPLR